MGVSSNISFAAASAGSTHVPNEDPVFQLHQYGFNVWMASVAPSNSSRGQTGSASPARKLIANFFRSGKEVSKSRESYESAQLMSEATSKFNYPF
jgi:hypothetical protein